MEQMYLERFLQHPIIMFADRLAGVGEVQEGKAAIILGAAINQDGRSSSLTAPNGPSQQQVCNHIVNNCLWFSISLYSLYCNQLSDWLYGLSLHLWRCQKGNSSGQRLMQPSESGMSLIKMLHCRS